MNEFTTMLLGIAGLLGSKVIKEQGEKNKEFEAKIAELETRIKELEQREP